MVHPAQVTETVLEDARQDATSRLGANLALTATFNAALAAVTWAAARQGRLPRHPRWGDIVLVGLGAFKISRLVTTDRITMPLRAPFLDPEGKQPTGRGMQRAMGELLTCPFCVTPWAALGLGAGALWAPRATRFVCGLLGAMTAADLLQRGYAWLQSSEKTAASHAKAAASGSINNTAHPAA